MFVQYFVTNLRQKISFVSGKPSMATINSSPEGLYRNSYNLTWSIKSSSPLEKVRILFRKMVSSMVIVMEFHRVSSKIQLFLSTWAYSKDFLIPCKTFWVRAVKNWEFSKFRIIFKQQISFDLPENDFLIWKLIRRTTYLIEF